MPVLHPITGEWCAGIGSVGVSRESRGLIAEHAGSACWLGEAVLYQREEDGRAFLESTVGAIDKQGANRLAAGGNVWAAWLAVVGYRDSRGRTSEAWSLAGVGPDGTVGVMLDRSTGVHLRLIAVDDHATDAPGAAPDDQTVQVLSASQAVWTEQGHQVIRSIGLPAFEFVTHVGFWLRVVKIDGVWWLLYQDERDRLLFHRADRTTGKLITQGNAFRPDVNAAGRIVYAINEGELPADIRSLNAFDLPDQDLRVSRPPADPPPVDPPVEPPKEPPVSTEPDQAPTDLDRAIAAALQVERDKYPKPLPLPTTDEGRRMLGRIINDAAYAVRVARGLGKLDVCLEGKDDDNTAIQPVTGLRVAKDIIQTVENGVRCGRDFLAATGAGEASIVFGTKGFIPEGKESVEAVPPASVPNPPPVDPPPVEPPPSNLEARLTALEARVLALEKRPQDVPPGLPPTVPPAGDGAATEATLLKLVAGNRELVDLVKGALGRFL